MEAPLLELKGEANLHDPLASLTCSKLARITAKDAKAASLLKL